MQCHGQARCDHEDSLAHRSKPHRKIGQRDESRKVKQPAKVVDGHGAQSQNPSDGYAKGRKDLCLRGVGAHIESVARKQGGTR